MSSNKEIRNLKQRSQALERLLSQSYYKFALVCAQAQRTSNHNLALAEYEKFRRCQKISVDAQSRYNEYRGTAQRMKEERLEAESAKKRLVRLKREKRNLKACLGAAAWEWYQRTGESTLDFLFLGRKFPRGVVGRYRMERLFFRCGDYLLDRQRYLMLPDSGIIQRCQELQERECELRSAIAQGRRVAKQKMSRAEKNSLQRSRQSFERSRETESELAVAYGKAVYESESIETIRGVAGLAAFRYALKIRSIEEDKQRIARQIDRCEQQLCAEDLKVENHYARQQLNHLLEQSTKLDYQIASLKQEIEKRERKIRDLL